MGLFDTFWPKDRTCPITTCREYLEFQSKDADLPAMRNWTEGDVVSLEDFPHGTPIHMHDYHLVEPPNRHPGDHSIDAFAFINDAGVWYFTLVYQIMSLDGVSLYNMQDFLATKE